MNEATLCLDCQRWLPAGEARRIPNGQGGCFVRFAETVGPFCLACFTERLSPNPEPVPVSILAQR